MTVAVRRVPRERRTQQERRESTIRKLLDAGTAALIDVGYAAASVQVICDRAGLSQGALFRHFPTREALMVAVGEDVGRKTLDRYRADFARLRGRDDPRDLAMQLVRARCRSRLNLAWYELAMASRTSPRLRRGLRPMAARYFRDIEDLARETLPELAAGLGDRFTLLVDTIVAVFDGETLHRFVLPEPEIERERIALLGLLARAFGT